MAREVEFYFDFGSPASYLAYTQLPTIALDCGATILWRPILLGGVFKATGNTSPVTVPPKGRWMQEDLERWARRYGVTFAFNPNFPINTLALMRGAVAIQMRQPSEFKHYVDVIFKAMWALPRNLGDSNVLRETLAHAGFDSEQFMTWVADPEVKSRLIANTEEAVARGAFGAPTFFVGKQMFFGQDRLDFVREALEQVAA